MSNKQDEAFREQVQEFMDDQAEEPEKDEDKAEVDGSEIEQPLPESPASVNIRFWAHGFGSQLTIRSNKVSDVLNKFQTVLTAIEKAGYKNVWDKEVPVVSNGKVAPTCGVHGTAMKWLEGTSKKTGKPYAFWTCPTKNADGSYCKYSPPKEDNA